MTKDDLKTGMVVETSNETKFLVMLNPDCEDRELIEFGGGYMPLSDYDDNLTVCDGYVEFDIVKVYRLNEDIYHILSDKDYAMKFAKLIWERKEKPIEMTVSEIEKKLGIKNLKIVKE